MSNSSKVSTPIYCEVELLGKGNFGTVYKVQCIKDGETYAFKLIPISNDEIISTKSEVNILKTLSHQNVIKCFGHFILEAKNNQYLNIPTSLVNPSNYKVLVLQLELCDCDVRSILNNRSSVNDNWNKKIFKQIVLGVEYLHANNIIHRDLKPANILLIGEIAKLTDFGVAKGGVFSWNANHSANVGTSFYMAPEVRTGSYNKTVDIYSLGVILIKFYTDNNVFKQWYDNLSQQIEYNTPMPKLDESGYQFINLIEKMTNKPDNRPSLSDIKKLF